MEFDEIIAYKRRRIAQCSRGAWPTPLARTRPVCSRGLRDRLLAGFGIIAEIKKASPSAGLLRPHYRPAALALAYEHAGACGISVLTCRKGFLGDLMHLRAAANAVTVPVLRKDFLLHPTEVREAWVNGADAVLLITSILDAASLMALASEADRLGLETIIEVHNSKDLRKAMDLPGWERRILGINNRNLRTMETDTRKSFELMEKVPRDTIVTISESGISHREDIHRLKRAGFRGALVGESLLRAPDPAEVLRRWCS